MSVCSILLEQSERSDDRNTKGCTHLPPHESSETKVFTGCENIQDLEPSQDVPSSTHLICCAFIHSVTEGFLSPLGTVLDPGLCLG